MSESSTRAQRVAGLLHQELAQILVNELKDPRVGFTTVTEVRVSGDLRSARVYVSVYGSEEEREATLAGLRAASGYLKRTLSDRLRLRYVPELSFARDDTLDKAQRLETIMHAISHGDTEVPASDSAHFLPVETSRTALAESAKSFEPPPATPPRGSRRRRRRHAPRF